MEVTIILEGLLQRKIILNIQLPDYNYVNRKVNDYNH